MTIMAVSYLMAFLGCGARHWGMLIRVLVQPLLSSMKPWIIALRSRWLVRQRLP